MAAPKTTIWKLEPHTLAKHEILKRYLVAWIPILTRGGFPEVLYIDGFAGPGRYSGGEDGSPIIAIKAALQHQNEISSKVYFRFIEKDLDRAACLQALVAEIDSPSNFDIGVRPGAAFEDEFDKVIDFYARSSRQFPPTFALIDPFGWKVPFRSVREFMARGHCEVMITFMYEEINRFIGHPQQEENFDSFFGTRGWRECVKIVNPRIRNRYLHDLYLQQLRDSAGAKYVRSFEMRNDRDVTDYFLFFATNHILGLKKMKAAMWKVDEGGSFTFSDATDPNQGVLFEKQPNFSLLMDLLIKEFSGHTVTTAEVEQFVVAETPFLDSHYKSRVLARMEKSNPPKLTVLDAPTNRRVGTFKHPNMRMRFE